VRNSGISYHSARYTINLAPADIKKDSSSLDLPIAIAILMHNGIIPSVALTPSWLL